MDLEIIREALVKHLEEKDLKLYDLKFDRKEMILSIIIDAQLNMDQLEEITNDLSDFMDGYDADLDKYLLDVTTVGIERDIRNDEEIRAAVGSYVFVKTKDVEVYGDLLSFEDGILTLSVKEKNLKKERSIKETEIKKMRYAVKF